MPYDCTRCDKKFRYKISLRTHKCIGLTVPVHSLAANNDATFMDNNNNNNNSGQQSLSSTCSPSLDELISESCNRMGIVDQIDQNQMKSLCAPTTTTTTTTENDINPNQSLLHFECDSFSLNDLNFCTVETSNADLANVMPSMNEIFPQTIELMNALYDNVDSDLPHFYNSAPQQ